MSPDVSPEQICLNGKLNGSQKHMPTHPSFIQVPLLHHASSCKVPSPKPSNNVRCCDPWRWAYSFMDLCMGNTKKKKHQKTSKNINKHQKTSKNIKPQPVMLSQQNPRAIRNLRVTTSWLCRKSSKAFGHCEALPQALNALQ